jgi:mRNA interferase RelE/StbE
VEVIARKSIDKDSKKLPKHIKRDLEQLVLKFIEADALKEISGIKKLKGHPNAFRVRIKNYRLGFFAEGDSLVLSRILHRKEIYRYFP